MLNLIIKLISKIHMPYNHKKMSEAECVAILNIVRSGDIILTHTKGELSSVFLNHWGHAAIYANWGLFEAVTAGVKESDLMFFLSRKDDVLILRPRFVIDHEKLERYCKYAIGTNYDYSFESGAEKLYCFELVADALITSSSINIDKKRTPLGKKYLAKSFLNENFEVVWQK
jgi:uncharacterized protein YycO